MPLASNTTLKISKETLSYLEQVKKELKARSLDETVRELIRSYQRPLPAGAFAGDKSRLKSFTERDRGEDR